MENVFISETGKKKSGSLPITLTLIKLGNNKLQLVKLIKDITGLGLKESKQIADNLAITTQIIKIWLTNIEILKLKSDLSSFELLEWELIDIEKSRNKKLIELGLGSKEDLVDELVDSDLYNLIINKFDYHTMKEILKSRYNSIPEENIKQILNIN